MKVVLHMVGAESLVGGGGAERRYALIYKEIKKNYKDIEIYFLTDQKSIKFYYEVDFLDRNDRNILVYKNSNNRFKFFLEKMRYRKLLKHIKPDIIQVCRMTPYEYYLIDELFNSGNRAKKIISIEHCKYGEVLNHFKETKEFNTDVLFLQKLFNLKWNGVFTHYSTFKKAFERSELNNNKDLNFFVSPNAFPSSSSLKPAIKKKQLIYAARLDAQKDPFAFLHALKAIQDVNNQFLSEWSVIILGKGVLENEVREFITLNFAPNLIKLDAQHDISNYLSESYVFVSTQHFENFPSFSLTDAMASGCIPIAGDVGDTKILIEDGKNGFLYSDTCSLKECIEKIIQLPEEDLISMSQLNYTTINEKHTIDTFIQSLVSYWQEQ